ncbi:MAG: hypothetical protein NC819_02140 [Candidatus Omnitrophica bacterium]|nr:hypothetical protein [Candidatus Omnitrophota bacterium]
MAKGKHPPFNKAMARFKELVKERGYSFPLRWVFRENLCLERTGRGEEERKISFQTRWPVVGEEDVRRVYVNLVREKSPVAFSVLEAAPAYTLCTLVGDTYHVDDDLYEPEWDIYFHLKKRPFIFEEISERGPWKRRKRWESINLNDFDYVPVLSYVKQQETWWGRLYARFRTEPILEEGVVLPVIAAALYLLAGLIALGLVGVLMTAVWLTVAFLLLWVSRLLKERWHRPLMGFIVDVLGWGWLLLTGLFLTMFRPI